MSSETDNAIEALRMLVLLWKLPSDLDLDIRDVMERIEEFGKKY